MVRVQAGRDVVYDVLKNQFLKESHRSRVIKTRYSRLLGKGTMTVVSRKEGTVSCESESDMFSHIHCGY